MNDLLLSVLRSVLVSEPLYCGCRTTSASSSLPTSQSWSAPAPERSTAAWPCDHPASLLTDPSPDPNPLDGWYDLVRVTDLCGDGTYRLSSGRCSARVGGVSRGTWSGVWLSVIAGGSVGATGSVVVSDEIDCSMVITPSGLRRENLIYKLGELRAQALVVENRRVRPSQFDVRVTSPLAVDEAKA